MLLNEMAAMGANYFFCKNIWRIFNYFLRESALYLEWMTTSSLFSILWEILMEMCALVAEKIRWEVRTLSKCFAEICLRKYYA